MNAPAVTPEAVPAAVAQVDQWAAVESMALAASAGDGAALGELVDRYRPLIWSVVRATAPHLPGTGLDRDDLGQIAALSFVELVQGYDPSRVAGFGSYIKTMLPWRVRNAVRWHKRRRSGEVPASAFPEDALEARAVTHQSPDYGVLAVESAALRAALGTLTDRQRQILSYLHGYDLTAPETARLLGVSSRCVNALRQKAETRLRERLAENAKRE